MARACTGAESIEAVREHKPDVAVLDLDMPVLDGLSATAQILREVPLVKIVLLTRHARPAALRRALASGAAAFVTETTSSEELPRIIRTVSQGGRYVDSRIASRADRRRLPVDRRGTGSAPGGLGRRHRERDRGTGPPRAGNRAELPVLGDDQTARGDQGRSREEGMDEGWI